MSIKSIAELNHEKAYWSVAASDVIQIAQPLMKYGITYFDYSRLYPGGIGDTVSTNPLAQKIFIESKVYKSAFLGDIDQYSPCVLFWDDLFEEDDLFEGYLADLRRINIGNGLLITVPGKDFVEFYFLASEVNNRKVSSFFLNNINFLYSFIDYFSDVAKDLKAESYENRVYYPGSADNSILTSPDMVYLPDSNTNVENSFKLMSDFYRLTPRERQCAQILMRGHTCKSIANQLNISARTAEKHLQTLRHKTNSRNFSQMFSKLYRIHS